MYRRLYIFQFLNIIIIMSITLNALGKNLAYNAAQLRTATATDLTTLSEISGVSRRTLGRIEAAKRARQTYRPMFSTVVKLADAAGVTIDDFVKNRLSFQ